MPNKTLHDMVNWTQNLHKDLAESMQMSVAEARGERERLLLTYLIGHEQELARMVGRYGENASETALKTWVSAYMEQFPPDGQPEGRHSFAGLATDEILEEVQKQHDKVLNIYRHLQDFVQGSAKELVGDLVNLEEQELLRISQSANRLEDL